MAWQEPLKERHFEVEWRTSKTGRQPGGRARPGPSDAGQRAQDDATAQPGGERNAVRKPQETCDLAASMLF